MQYGFTSLFLSCEIVMVMPKNTFSLPVCSVCTSSWVLVGMSWNVSHTHTENITRRKNTFSMSKEWETEKKGEQVEIISKENHTSWGVKEKLLSDFPSIQLFKKRKEKSVRIGVVSVTYREMEERREGSFVTCIPQPTSKTARREFWLWCIWCVCEKIMNRWDRFTDRHEREREKEHPI